MENENKISSMAGSAHCTEEIMSACALCPRECLADRGAGKKGFCGMDERIYLARAALHMWEEPCISGTKGSGAVFFSGCGLRCCFCQNHDIAMGSRGRAVSVERLGEIFLELKEKGAANINLVTGAHYVPQIIEALDMAWRKGLDIPVVYNSSGYEKTETLKLLEGYVDIYLPDLKYLDPELAQKFSYAPDYVQAAKAAIREMVRQTGKCEFGEDGGIWDLSEFVDGEDQAQNLKKYVGDSCLELGRNSDGSLIGIVARRATTANSNIFIRKDWLDDLVS